jgi:two-component system, OmpR family, response regulator QseB
LDDPMRLLLVEDEKILGDGIRAGLIRGGFTVDWLQDGRAAQLALADEAYAAVVLDLGLPRLSGLALLKDLRDRGDATPVLILTARDTLDDRVHGLDQGADDYLVKPFELEELKARIRALVRRGQSRAEPVLQHGAITLDPAARSVAMDGAPVELSQAEYIILEELLSNIGRVRSVEQLQQSLYGWNDDVESNVVAVHVHFLRKKLGGDLVRTLRGIGYVIDKSE